MEIGCRQLFEGVYVLGNNPRLLYRATSKDGMLTFNTRVSGEKYKVGFSFDDSASAGLIKGYSGPDSLGRRRDMWEIIEEAFTKEANCFISKDVVIETEDSRSRIVEYQWMRLGDKFNFPRTVQECRDKYLDEIFAGITGSCGELKVIGEPKIETRFDNGDVENMFGREKIIIV